MSAFQDQVKRDLNTLFFNQDEHAEAHKIDDAENVLCIIDTDVSQPLDKPKVRRDGIRADKFILYVRETDLPGVPEYDQIIRFDDVRHRVINRNISAGMIQMTLEVIG